MTVVQQGGSGVLARVGEDREVLDPRQLRHAFGRFATGITVITTQALDGKREGLTANSFGALSLDPPLVLWSLGRDAMSLPNFRRSPYFAVNVLGAHQRGISDHFARPAVDKFANVAWQPGIGGCPKLPGCLASFECRLERTLEIGDHVVFIGRVERFESHSGEPLVFSTGRYCRTATLPTVPPSDSTGTQFADLWL